MNIADQITNTLEEQIAPDWVLVEDESHQHHVPKGSQSHFKVTLVSASFEGLSLVKRHQAVYRVLNPFLEQGVHALALHTFTPSEWEQKGKVPPASPDCRGGSRTS